MIFDVRTLVLVTGILYLVQALVFLHQYRVSRNIQGPGWWLAWSVLEAAGFGLMLLRGIPVLPSWIIMMQNPLILAGTIAIYFGIQRFQDRPLNLWFIIPFYLIFLLVHFYFVLKIDSHYSRVLVLNIYLAIVGLVTAANLTLHSSRSCSSIARLISAFFYLQGLAFTHFSIRMITGIAVGGMLEPNTMNLIQCVDALLGGILLSIGFIFMVNMKRRTEISETKERFEPIFDKAPDAVVITSLDPMTLVECNAQFTKVFGYTREEVVGKTTQEVDFWQNASDRDEFIRLMGSQGFVENLEVRLRTRDNKEFVGLMSANFVELDGVQHIMSVTRDIGDLKKVEEEMRQKIMELEKLNAERDRFHSIIAHDLRGPFTSYLGLIRHIVENLPNLPMEELELIVHGLEHSAVNLYSLLENLLGWSRVKQGLMPFHPENLNLAAMVEESAGIILEPSKGKELEIKFNIPARMFVYADRSMLQTILRNLLSNSLKFTPPGGEITVKAERQDNSCIRISVADTGIGMSPEMVGDLFRLDSRVFRKGTEGEPSTGLGLLLCKEFIGMHGGTISFDSEVGRGTSVHFTLPLKR